MFYRVFDFLFSTLSWYALCSISVETAYIQEGTDFVEYTSDYVEGTTTAYYEESTTGKEPDGVSTTQSVFGVFSPDEDFATRLPVLVQRNKCNHADVFRCATGECIKSGDICDGKYDCLLGDDEEFDCGESTTVIFATISMVSGSLFAFLFMHMYYIRIRMLEGGFVRHGGDVVDDSYRRYIRLIETAVRMTEEAEQENGIVRSVSSRTNSGI